jgi:hypothetical protein
MLLDVGRFRPRLAVPLHAPVTIDAEVLHAIRRQWLIAESLDVPLWTRDARLARSSGHAARIEYIA